jgi:plastocyanin
MRLIAVLAALPLCVLSSAPVRAEDNVITIKHFMFNPMDVTIPAGADVTWENQYGEPHTVVSLTGDFRSQALDEKDKFSHRFDKPGIYKYLCSIHPKMVGTITVVADKP